MVNFLFPFFLTKKVPEKFPIHLYCFEIAQNVSFEFFNFGIFHYFLSGNTIWPQASGFQKLAKLIIFGIFKELLST